ncbi:MAG: hypothetical protein J3Q66DRAFT_389148 [Benniella sp.]|nr:MAG: hypothetical protein J3Q66DRAFT_389148 [Benniella sp.]
MGIRGLVKFFEDKGVPHTTRQRFTEDMVHVDMMSVFYPLLRARHYQALSDEASRISKRINATQDHGVFQMCSIIQSACSSTASVINRQLREKGVTPDNATLHFDGARSQGKHRAHLIRRNATIQSLTTLRQEAAEYLTTGNGNLTSILRRAKNNTGVPGHFKEGVCEFESDVCMARTCGPTDIIMSGDSDAFVYSTIQNVAFATQNGERSYEMYKKYDILQTLDITSDQLSLLGIITQNDYNVHIQGMTTRRNYEEFIMDNEFAIDQGAEPAMAFREAVQAYKNQFASPDAQGEFHDAIDVFVDFTEAPLGAEQILPPIDDANTVLEMLVQIESHKIQSSSAPPVQPPQFDTPYWSIGLVDEKGKGSSRHSTSATLSDN